MDYSLTGRSADRTTSAPSTSAAGSEAPARPAHDTAGDESSARFEGEGGPLATLVELAVGVSEHAQRVPEEAAGDQGPPSQSCSDARAPRRRARLPDRLDQQPEAELRGGSP